MGATVHTESAIGKHTEKDMYSAYDNIVRECIWQSGDDPYNGTLSTTSDVALPAGVTIKDSMPEYVAYYITNAHWGNESYLKGGFKKWGRAIALPVKIDTCNNGPDYHLRNHEADTFGIHVSTDDVIVSNMCFGEYATLDLMNKEIRKKVISKVNRARTKSARKFGGDTAKASAVTVSHIAISFPGLTSTEEQALRNAYRPNRMVRASEIIGKRNVTAKVTVYARYTDGTVKAVPGWLFSGMCAE